MACGVALSTAPARLLLSTLRMSTPRIFLLSPAFAGGKRGEMVMRDAASFPLARQLREPGGAPLGDVFSFLSGLYFRGKMAYVRRFAEPLGSIPGALVITPTRGLVPPESHITVDVLREFAAGAVEVRNAGYRGPLEMHARALAEHAPEAKMVLLGSIASDKYVDVLTGIFGERLVFPVDFVGRGDMSRGGLMLRCVTAGLELDYVPLEGAVRHGQRPPRLEPIKHAARRDSR